MTYWWMAPDNPGGYCPYFHQTIELIGRRWTGAIFFAVNNGKSHFGEIKEAVPGLSDRMLCERLAELGDAGVVDRVVEGRSVVYLSSAKGEALYGALESLHHWATDWWDL